MSSARNRLVIVEPSAVITEGLKSILADSSAFGIVECTSDLSFCIERLPSTTPNAILIDPTELPVQHLRNLVSDRTIALIAVIHTLHDEEQLAQFDAVISIYDSPQLILRKLHGAVEQCHDESSSESGCDLSEREREILVAVAHGLTNKEIADLRNISIHTVISHRKNISRKTGIKSIAGLTVYAIMNNLISPTDTTYEAGTLGVKSPDDI